MSDKIKYKIDHIAHIAVAVNHLDEIKVWENILNIKKKSQYISEEQKVRVIVFETDGFKIEFMSPTSSDSPISKFLEKNSSGGIHHICFKTKDLDMTINHFKSNKIRKITRDSNTKGINKKNICFFHPNDLNNILLELEEE